MEARLSPNLLKQVTEEFRGDGLNQIASVIGETPAKTQTALSAAIPALLSVITSKASTTAGAGELLNAMRNNNLDTAQFTSVANILSSPNNVSTIKSTGQSLLNSLLGSRTGGVTDWIASHAGVNRGSAGSLLSLALPIILTLIGRRAASSGGGVSGLMNLFGGQNFLSEVPAGLAGVLGLGGATAAARHAVADVERRATVYEPTPAKTSSWWKWVLPLVLLAGLGWLLYSLLNKPAAPTVAVTTPTVTAPAAPAPAVPNVPTASLPNVNLGAFFDKKLPNGISLHIPGNGVENRLLAFIENPAQAVNKETWFSFDRLEFETDSARLKPSSQEQLKNVAEILKAYPNVNLKIGGYTDNTGNPAHNLQLSQDRAVSSLNELVALGINKTRLEAEGYGEKFPVADNATEEGKQRNRRIDMRVTKK